MNLAVYVPAFVGRVSEYAVSAAVDNLYSTFTVPNVGSAVPSTPSSPYVQFDIVGAFPSFQLFSTDVIVNVNVISSEVGSLAHS